MSVLDIRFVLLCFFLREKHTHIRKPSHRMATGKVVTHIVSRRVFDETHVRNVYLGSIGSCC
jgi:hypothetical protein